MNPDSLRTFCSHRAHIGTGAGFCDECEKLFQEGKELPGFRPRPGSMAGRTMSEVLGSLLAAGYVHAPEVFAPHDVDVLVAEIDAARSRQDFRLADEIRDRLVRNGYVLQHRKDGRSEWQVGWCFHDNGTPLLRGKTK
jgi:hypothetical protein